MQESSSNWPFYMMVGWAGGMNRPSVGDTSLSGVPALTAPQYNLETPTTPGRGNSQGRKRARSQDDANDANDAKRPKKQTIKRPYCGKCIGCLEKEDCGICANCKDKTKSGGPGKRHARCIKRQCQKLKYGPKEQTTKNVGKCVAATKSGTAGRSQATGNPGGARNTSLSQTIENDSKDPCTNDWCSSEVSKDDEHKAQSAGHQQLQQQQQQQKQLEIGNLTVQLNHSIGYGSFGTVYEASYQGTPVAAKYLYHPVQDYERFKHKLKTLQGLIHPNLVAYQAAAMCPTPQSSRPIVVMELMEKSLTQFLGEVENDVPVHLQVNLCLDIAFALAYLHSQQIVHGHLTSNNVLLVGTTAKVADFGMSKLLDSQSSVTQPALQLPPEAREHVTHSQRSEKSDVFSFGMLVVQIVSRQALTFPELRQQLAPLSEEDRRQQRIIASAHPLRDIAFPCLRESAMERPTVKKVVTKLSTVRYHSQYVASLKQERQKVQQEIVQLKEKLKSKEEFALKENQEGRKQLGTAKWEIAQLKEKLKSNKELALKENQESRKQLETAKWEIAQLKEKLKSNKELALKEIQESQKQVGIAKREIAQLKEKLKSKKELVFKQKQESQEQMKQLQQQLRDKDQKITIVPTTYGTQLVMTSKLQNESERALALRKDLEEKLQERDKQIQACEMEVKILLQQSQKKDIKISELEAWKKTTKDKLLSLASVAEL